MEFKEISEKAYKHEEIDPKCNIAIKYAYVSMMHLYSEYKRENISKEEAEKEKRRIEKEYNHYSERVKKYYEVFEKQNEIRGKYQEFLVEIEKSQDTDNILINSLKFIENIIQDSTFFDRNYNKVKDVDNEN